MPLPSLDVTDWRLVCAAAEPAVRTCWEAEQARAPGRRKVRLTAESGERRTELYQRVVDPDGWEDGGPALRAALQALLGELGRVFEGRLQFRLLGGPEEAIAWTADVRVSRFVSPAALVAEKQSRERAWERMLMANAREMTERFKVAPDIILASAAATRFAVGNGPGPVAKKPAADPLNAVLKGLGPEAVSLLRDLLGEGPAQPDEEPSPPSPPPQPDTAKSRKGPPLEVSRSFERRSPIRKGTQEASPVPGKTGSSLGPEHRRPWVSLEPGTPPGAGTRPVPPPPDEGGPDRTGARSEMKRPQVPGQKPGESTQKPPGRKGRSSFSPLALARPSRRPGPESRPDATGGPGPSGKAAFSNPLGDAATIEGPPSSAPLSAPSPSSSNRFDANADWTEAGDPVPPQAGRRSPIDPAAPTVARMAALAWAKLVDTDPPRSRPAQIEAPSPGLARLLDTADAVIAEVGGLSPSSRRSLAWARYRVIAPLRFEAEKAVLDRVEIMVRELERLFGIQHRAGA